MPQSVETRDESKSCRDIRLKLKIFRFHNNIMSNSISFLAQWPLLSYLFTFLEGTFSAFSKTFPTIIIRLAPKLINKQFPQRRLQWRAVYLGSPPSERPHDTSVGHGRGTENHLPIDRLQRLLQVLPDQRSKHDYGRCF